MALEEELESIQRKIALREDEKRIAKEEIKHINKILSSLRNECHEWGHFKPEHNLDTGEEQCSACHAPWYQVEKKRAWLRTRNRPIYGETQ